MNFTPSHRPVRLSLVVAALALTGLVAGCGASGSSSSADSSSSASSGGSGGSTASLAEVAPRNADEAAAAAPQGGVATTGEEAVISTGTVSLRAKDVGDLLLDVQQAVDQVRGDVSERTSESDDEGRVTRSRLVVRVPADSFGELMGALEETGTLVSSDSSSQDVTAQVIDNRVRVSVQKASIRRIQALLAQAVDLADVVSIEAELSSRQAELNSLEQTQAYLADQTSQSTITVSLRETRTPLSAVPAADDDGFLSGLSAGWDALTGFGTGAATIAGALLPWLVLLGVLGAPAVALARRLRRRTSGAPGAAPTT